MIARLGKGTGELETRFWDSTAETEQSGQDSQDRTVRTGQQQIMARSGSQDRKVMTGR